MPTRPAWFQRLPEILDILRGLDAEHRDLQAAPNTLSANTCYV